MTNNITITACANSTPPANTVVATQQLADSSHAQLMVAVDRSGNALGPAGSPISASVSGIIQAASAVVTNQVSASISNTLTVGNALSASVSAIGGQVSASISNLAGSAAGSPLFVSVTNSPSVVVSSGSVVVTNALSASISNTVNTAVLNLAGSAAGSPLFFSQTNQTGSAAGSPTFVSVTNAASVIVSSGSVVVTNGLSASISNTVTTTGSTVVTNQVSASVSNVVTVAQGASGASPWGVRVLDAAGNAYGVGAGSPLYITGGAAGGTSATDKATYAEGTTSFTPVGGLFSTTTVALTASQSGAVRMTAQRALHTSLRDDAGNILGVTGSPLVITGGAAGGTSATDQGVFGEGAGTYTPAGFQFFDAAASLTACQAGVGRMTAFRAQHVNLRDASGNQLGVTGSPLVTSFGSGSVTNQVSASISNTLTVGNALSASISGGSVALLSGANVIGSASAIQGTPAAITAPWPVKISDGTDSVAVTGASLLQVDGSGTTASRIITAGSVVVTNGVSASISNTVTTTGSTVVTNQVSASISNVASVIVTSGSNVITNIVSASIGSGSIALLAGANTIGAASAIQGAAACPAAAWPVYLTGNGGSRLGISGSPLIVEDDNGSLAISGSILTVVSQDISASTSGCTIIVSGCVGFQVRVIGVTFTTSASQRIGWISGSNTATSALVQTPMSFATFGGMDINRGPWGYVWQGGSGSALIITTTTACYVAGNMSFVRVPG